MHRIRMVFFTSIQTGGPHSGPSQAVHRSAQTSNTLFTMSCTLQRDRAEHRTQARSVPVRGGEPHAAGGEAPVDADLDDRRALALAHPHPLAVLHAELAGERRPEP